MTKWVCLVCVALLMVAAVGCEENHDGGVEFVNEAQWVVIVYPNLQSGWSEFTLKSGESHTIDIRGEASFTYRPATKVRADTSAFGRVVFYNR